MILFVFHAVLRNRLLLACIEVSCPGLTQIQTSVSPLRSKNITQHIAMEGCIACAIAQLLFQMLLFKLNAIRAILEEFG